MRIRIWHVLVFLVVANMVASAPAEDPSPGSEAHEMLDAVVWEQTSAEFYAAARQAFNAATEKMDLGLRDKFWTASPKQLEAGKFQDLPPAVVVNVDETVISNTPYISRLILKHSPMDWTGYDSWAKEAKCPAIPGAKKFLDHAADRDVAIIYNTMRPDQWRQATISNLKWLEYPFDSDKDELIMGSDWSSALEKHRILVVVGDTLSDFMLESVNDAAKRREQAAQCHSYWGMKWFIIPNPMMGQWEDALSGEESNRSAIIRNKMRFLKTEPDAEPNSK
jgi:5'-nucleotidase (lipoprotein e(P4) family)